MAKIPIDEVIDDHFHNCTALESAMKELFGNESCWQASASWFDDPRTVRKALSAAMSTIEKHARERINCDERLREMLLLCTRSLQDEVRQLKSGATNQLDIVALLLEMVVRLLGYDHRTGETNREVIYYQTQEQMKRDIDCASATGRPNRLIEDVKRHEIIRQLLAEGLPETQIALILNIPYAKVRLYLRDEDSFLRAKKSLASELRSQKTQR
jgi:hypothetical protein